MFCSNCGKEISGHEKFCPACGNALQEQGDSFHEQQNYNFSQENSTVNSNYNSNNKNNGNRIIIILLCVLIGLLALGFVLVAALSIGGNAEKTQQSSFTVESTTEKESEKTTTKKSETTKKVETAKENSETKATDNYGIVYPDYRIADERLYVEPREGLYLRKGPGKNYSRIRLLDRGVGVVVEGACNDAPDWSYVRVIDSSDYGWVNTSYLTSNRVQNYRKDQYFKYSSSYTVTVSDREGLNLRSEATKDSHRYGTIPYDRSMTVLGYSAYDSRWLYVSVYLDGRTQYGFVDSSYVR